MVVNDRVDLRRQIKDWSELDFADDDWPQARPLMRKIGWPSPQKDASPQALTPPWTSLIPRDLPYLLEKEERAVNLIEGSFIEGKIVDGQNDQSLLPIHPFPINGRIDKSLAKSLPRYKNSEGSLIIPASDKPGVWFLLFDLGQNFLDH